LRDENNCDVPAPITPELLTMGRDFISANVVPAFDSCHDSDFMVRLNSSEMSSLK